MSGLKVTAFLHAPLIGELGPLDGPLSWAFWQKLEQEGNTHHIEDITPDYCQDFPLPLEKWEKNGVWGWKTSTAIYTPDHYSTVEIRRRPATPAMAAYTSAKEHHNGLGPMKAGNRALGTLHASRVDWFVNPTDQGALEELLGFITHLGARHRNGFGKVIKWETTPDDDTKWVNRLMPASTGPLTRPRAPYWHPTLRTPMRNPTCP